MRILLDNCVTRHLQAHIPGHSVTTVAKLGWNRLEDGALLDAAENSCDVFITLDKSIPFQQRISQRKFAIVVLRTKSSRLEHLLPLVPSLLRLLPDLKPGELQEIAED